MPNYSIQAGDCCSRIAQSIGATDYHAVYDAAENAALRTSAPNPNQIMSSGTIFVPPSESVHPAPANATHAFTASTHGVKLRIKLLDATDHPAANLAYRLDFTGSSLAGTTNAQGLIERDISASEIAVTLVVRFPARPAPAAAAPAASAASPPPYPAPLDPTAFIDRRDDAYIGAPDAAELTWELHIGGLTTFGAIHGVQGRLLNLGIGRSPVDGAAGNPLTSAVRLYQTRYHLTPVDGNWESIKNDLKTRHDLP